MQKRRQEALAFQEFMQHWLVTDLVVFITKSELALPLITLNHSVPSKAQRTSDKNPAYPAQTNAGE
jgi:hypothetical protein